ncbi:MAG: serine/threonine-protein kinase [Caldilineaceae bacterium]|nr:serine/threonine-protein kinase [Caldilineaceae bacterium]
MSDEQDYGTRVAITDSMRADFIRSCLTMTPNDDDVVLKTDLRKFYASWLTERHNRYDAGISNSEASKLYNLLEEILGPVGESTDANGRSVFTRLVLSHRSLNPAPHFPELNIEIPPHVPWELTGERLGSGGQGHVYLVTKHNSDDDKQFALKLLRNPTTPQARARFRREIEAVQNIDHPSIIRIHDYSEPDEDFQFYVMDFHPGARSLDSIILSQSTNPFHGNVSLCLNLLEKIVTAIGVCEKNSPQIIHRDINPQNILVLPDDSIRLIDFGICHFENGETITLTDENVGRRNYTAPECESGASSPSICSDFYSTAKTLWATINSRNAFSREESVFSTNPDSMQSRFPNNPDTWHLEQIFIKTIRKNPSDRFANTDEFLESLSEIRYKTSRGFPPRQIAHTRCPSCGDRNFSDLPDAETKFGPLHTRSFGATQCDMCGFVILRNRSTRNKIEAKIQDLQ